MKERNKIILVVLVVIVLLTWLTWLGLNNTLSMKDKEQTKQLPSRIVSIENIGEWEFLTINDEEMIDTIRHGFFGDDELVRIYYGTLRIGINLHEAKKGWIRMEQDTLFVTLPSVRLLDENFIDEARTQSFFETGSWSQQDRENLYHKAYATMRRRCLTEKNMQSARENASRQFYTLLSSMGFENIRIEHEQQ